jgi:hypothetical protein
LLWILNCNRLYESVPERLQHSPRDTESVHALPLAPKRLHY